MKRHVTLIVQKIPRNTKPTLLVVQERVYSSFGSKTSQQQDLQKEKHPAKYGKFQLLL